MLTHGSTFSGIGGIDLGFERAGIKTVWQVEKSKYCRYVLRKNFAGVKQFSDIRKVGKRNLPPVDVISGGFPCQPFSLAGKQRGERDNRFLWPEMFRVIDELRPPWVLAENVPGIIKLALDRVLADLEGIGYRCWPVGIPACALGAPHIRMRIWIIAHSERDTLRNQSRRRNGADGADSPIPANDGEQRIVAIPDGGTNRGLHGGWPDKAKTSEFAGFGQDVANADGGGFTVQGEPSRGGGFPPCSREDVADSRREGFACRGIRSGKKTNGEMENVRPTNGGENVANAECTERRAVTEGRNVGNGHDSRREEASSRIGTSGENVGNASGAGCAQWKGPATEWAHASISGATWWAVEPDVGRVAHGIPARVDRLRALGNAVIPQIAEAFGKMICALESS